MKRCYMAVLAAFILMFLLGCQKSMTAVEFMYNTGAKLQVGSTVYDSHSTKEELDELNNCGDVVLTVHFRGDIHEILLKSKWQWIGDTPYEVAGPGG